MNSINIDKDILFDLIAGKNSALATLYSKYAEAVYHLSYQLLKDTGWSEDNVQEVFHKVWQNRQQLRVDSVIWPYLYTLTKREALNKLRSIKRSQTAFDNLLLHIQQLADAADHAILNKELALEIQNHFNCLPKQQEKVLLLSKVEGLSYKEIAEKMNISPNTVKNHLSQAVKFLKQSKLSQDYLPLIMFFLFHSN